SPIVVVKFLPVTAGIDGPDRPTNPYTIGLTCAVTFEMREEIVDGRQARVVLTGVELPEEESTPMLFRPLFGGANQRYKVARIRRAIGTGTMTVLMHLHSVIVERIDNILG